MKALIVIGCILLVLFLLGRIRVGAAVAYSEAGVFLRIKAGPAWLQILPSKKEKKDKPPKEKKKKEKPPEGTEGEQPKKKGSIRDTVSLALRFVPLLGEAAGRFKRRLRIDLLKLHITWGAADPASAAQGFGAGNAAMGILWPAFARNFQVKDYDLHVGVDFERKTPAIDARAQLTVTIGQIFSLGVILAFKALKIYLGYRRDTKDKRETRRQEEKQGQEQMKQKAVQA